jgi:hypothetical protein
MNIVYPAAKQLMLEAGLNWLTDPIYGILLDTRKYEVSLAHSSLADIDEGAFLVASSVMTGRTCEGGAADADDLGFPSYTGAPATALILVRDGGTALQSKLIAYMDTLNGLPFVPDGDSVIVEWDNGPARIFSL